MRILSHIHVAAGLNPPRLAKEVPGIVAPGEYHHNWCGTTFLLEPDDSVHLARPWEYHIEYEKGQAVWYAICPMCGHKFILMLKQVWA